MGVYIGLVLFQLIYLVRYVNMKKILLTLLLVFIGISQSNSAVINRIVGLNADCGNACQPIPLNVLILCDNVNCPRTIAPSFTDEQRFWGSRDNCRTSINGGITWVSCPTQPFNTGGIEYYAEASDGAIIGVARLTTPNRTSIKRSVDKGVTWNTVYEDTTNLVVSDVGSSKVRCFLDGYCFVISTSGNDSHFFVLESVDSGQTWFVAFTKNNNDPSGQNNGFLNATQIKNFIDHSVVASPGLGYSITPIIYRGMMKIGNVWNTTALLNSGSVTCWGSFISNNTPYGMCYDTQRRIINLTTGLVEKSPTFNPGIFATSDGGMSYGYNSTTIYSLLPTLSSFLGVYVSKDSGLSFTRIFEYNFGIREGDFWKHPINGCLYFSAGFGNFVVGRIC
jgi:hypothetical protein